MRERKLRPWVTGAVASVALGAHCSGTPIYLVVGEGGDASADGSPVDGSRTNDGALADGRVVRGPFATRVVSFDPGPGAGFGQDHMPDVVLGPPVGAGDMMGGTDVVSLGRNGRICLAFDDVDIVDGPGADFIVFENPFYAAGTATTWAELGEVSVSFDGVAFVTYPCQTMGPPYPGCAGWTPVYSRPGGISPSDVTNAGGDAFDLATVALPRVRYVCVRDLATHPIASPATGFDLDAIAAVNYAPP